jgi:Putative transposase
LSSARTWSPRPYRGIDDGETGAITFVQRFGSALNLNVHFHILTPDGLFVPNSAGTLSFTPLEPPSGEDVERLTHRVVRRLSKPAPAKAGDRVAILRPQQRRVPRSRRNHTRYHGVFANRSRHRPLLLLPPEANGDGTHDANTNTNVNASDLSEAQDPGVADEPGVTYHHDDLSDLPAVRPRKLTWASLLKRSLGVSGHQCPAASLKWFYWP